MEEDGYQSKEHMWCAKLDKKSKAYQWEGRDDGQLEQLVLKRACLGPGAKASERNIVEVTSFNYKQEKIEACICSLSVGLHEDVSLTDLTVFPPAIFKLVEGNGPVHVVANHMMMEMDDMDDDSDQDFDENDLSDAMSDEDEEEEEEEEEKVNKVQIKPIKKVKPIIQENGRKLIDDEAEEDDEDSEDDEEEEEEEEVEVKPTPVSKKRKLEEQKSPPKKKKAVEAVKTPDSKKKVSSVPSTPVSQKENKAPLSGKKTPAKVYETVDEVKAAIKKYPGGKPKKEDKFCNWVKSAFKVKDETWVKELWKTHKKEMGL